MLTTILGFLIVLWLLNTFVGGGLFFLHRGLFSLNGHGVSLWELLVFALVVWLLNILPSPFRKIVALFLLLWLLSVFGFIVIVGLPNLLVLLLIAGLVLYILGII